MILNIDIIAFQIVLQIFSALCLIREESKFKKSTELDS